MATVLVSLVLGLVLLAGAEVYRRGVDALCEWKAIAGWCVMWAAVVLSLLRGLTTGHDLARRQALIDAARGEAWAELVTEADGTTEWREVTKGENERGE